MIKPQAEAPGWMEKAPGWKKQKETHAGKKPL